MQYLSTFTGIGGFELGIHAAIDDAECIGYSEVDKYAIQTYENHYEHHNYGDNSKHFGVPQSRERIYIIGHLRDRCARQILPLTGSQHEDISLGEHESRGPQKFIKTRHLSQNGGLVSDSITLQASEIPHVVQIGQMYDNPHNSQAGRIYDQDGVSPTLDVMGGGNRQPKIIQRPRGKNAGGLKDIAPTVSSSKYQDNNHVVDYLGNPKDVANTIDSNYHKGPSPNGHQSKQRIYKVDGRIRRLTPIECERLQGFPDNWTIGSDTQRYKQCGNAVTTKVVEAVMTKLKECLI